MENNIPSFTINEEPYILRLIEDIKYAEAALRGAIGDRSQDVINNHRTNVDRLHKLLATHPVYMHWSHPQYVLDREVKSEGEVYISKKG